MQIAIIKGKAFEFKDDNTLVPMDDCVVEAKGKTDLRSAQQNRTLHMWLEMIAGALNDAGLDIKQVIKADVSWTMTSVKEIIWRSIQKAITHKQSSTKLTQEEFSQTVETVNRLMGEKYGIHVKFPSIDNMLIEGQINDN